VRHTVRLEHSIVPPPSRSSRRKLLDRMSALPRPPHEQIHSRSVGSPNAASPPIFDERSIKFLTLSPPMGVSLDSVKREQRWEEVEQEREATTHIEKAFQEVAFAEVWRRQYHRPCHCPSENTNRMFHVWIGSFLYRERSERTQHGSSSRGKITITIARQRPSPLQLRSRPGKIFSRQDHETKSDIQRTVSIESWPAGLNRQT